jgi:hypothetical protein
MVANNFNHLQRGVESFLDYNFATLEALADGWSFALRDINASIVFDTKVTAQQRFEGWYAQDAVMQDVGVLRWRYRVLMAVGVGLATAISARGIHVYFKKVVKGARLNRA